MKRIQNRGWTNADILRDGLLLVAAAVLVVLAGQSKGSDASADAQTGGSSDATPTIAAPLTNDATDPTGAAPAQPTLAQAAPDCASASLTPAQTEGPYFTPGSPERVSLLQPGLAGTRLVISSMVMTADCQPVAGAMLDFWQADDAGQYDNAGFNLRGHEYTDEAGAFQMETIVPGLYPGRTRHVHVKIQAPGQPALTTQLYFPGEAGNARDGIFDPRLVLDVQQGADGLTGTISFVLPR